jgi:DHA3 family macrolide efflux protein-like MFS transporter
MQSSTKKQDAPAPITNQKSMKDFLIIFTGQAFSLFGSQLVQFTLVWWLTLTTFASASVLAIAMIAALLPQIILSPFIGPFIDRWNRREVMIIADSVIALSVIILALLFAFNLIQVWQIYVIMFVRSVGSAFHWPAMQASTTMMVPKKHLSRVNGLTQSLQGLMNIIAPPLGAILIEIMPVQNILSIDIGTALLAISPLLFIRIPQPKINNKLNGIQQSVLADLKDAIKFMLNWKGGLYILIAAMIINLLIMPAISLLPILVVNHFNAGALEFASLTSAMGIGMVLGGIILSIWGGFKKRIVTGMLSFILMGTSLSIIGALPPTALLVAIMVFFIAGFVMPIGNGSIFAILQAMVPPEMQGRVFTLVMSGSAAMTPIGLAIAGPVADLLGVQIWFIVGGIGMIMVGIFAFFSSAVMRIEEENPS